MLPSAALLATPKRKFFTLLSNAPLVLAVSVFL